ncbi:hypothetical protein DMC61_14510 [Amycolatopsis sp. WAC 04169]|uniref:hypothetical protein n=1 Tax=Amycolatopsis sp. WAC 04169 TaxID=2203197 RepID=UPI000F79C536|nr:hypothetical protein [Amycolatopsis sp. WAC 04169]RSN31358.1 hypothetical protein DMC61_14510 [Amycolatopsis sp. WAC 04169]
MIDSVELVVAALGAGAAVGARETASTAVKDAYASVKTLALRTLRRGEGVSPAAVAAVEADAITPIDSDSGVVQRGELEAALTTANAGADEALVAAALKVLELTDSVQAGKYRVSLYGNKGVQVGDHNTQTNNFN